MAIKKYSDAVAYDAKLEKVMARLGVDSYDYDWGRRECWVSFTYKGQTYRFSHSLENAREHGSDIQYGSDLFAQVVLSLEDLARMVERGIYDLSTWVAGMKYLPPAEPLEPCFAALGFSARPETEREVKTRYRQLAKVMHPDTGGSDEDMLKLQKAYEACLEQFKEAAEYETTDER